MTERELKILLKREIKKWTALGIKVPIDDKTLKEIIRVKDKKPIIVRRVIIR